MKPFIINANSWHYRFVCDSTHWGSSRDKNLCSYTRAFMWAAFTCLFRLAFMAVFGVVAFGTILLPPFYALAVWVLRLTPDNYSEFGQVITGFYAIVAACAYMGVSIVRCVSYLQNRQPQPSNVERGIVGAILQNFRDKTCMRVEIDHSKAAS